MFVCNSEIMFPSRSSHKAEAVTSTTDKCFLVQMWDQMFAHTKCSLFILKLQSRKKGYAHLACAGCILNFVFFVYMQADVLDRTFISPCSSI